MIVMGSSYLGESFDEAQVAVHKVHPVYPLAFVGTENGDLFVINLVERSIIHRESFYQVDEFGEPQKIEEPVRDLAFSDNHELIYAFTRTGAVCLEIKTLRKVAEIPLDEPLVSGHVSSETGNIAILTEDGYVSRWTPKFHSRLGFFELNKGEALQKIRMIDSDTIIGLGKRKSLFLLNFTDHKVSKAKYVERANYLFVDSPIQANENYFVHLTKDKRLVIGDLVEPRMNYFTEKGSRDLDKDVVKVPATEMQVIYHNLKDQFSKLGDLEVEFHQDSRFTRISKDKYYATSDHMDEIQKIKQELKGDWDPNLILHYAIKEYIEGDEKVGPLRIIMTISQEHGIDPKFAIYAWKLNGRRKSGLITLAKRLSIEAEIRRKKIRKIIFSKTVIFFIMISVAIFIFPPPSSTVISLLGLAGNMVLFRKASQVNKVPKIPFIETFLSLRIFIFIVNWVTGLFILSRECGILAIFLQN